MSFAGSFSLSRGGRADGEVQHLPRASVGHQPGRHGTDIAGSLRRTYKGHDRVFIISDMQTISGGVADAVPRHVPIYGFNLGGHQKGAYATSKANRHEFGGLTDATFRMVPLPEAGQNAGRPF